jgi:RNA polymerase sigma factor (sigma-70 family)
MNVHVSYKLSKTPDVEREIKHRIEKLARRLQVFRPELVHLHGNIEENNSRHGVVFTLNLRLPSGQLAAQATAPTATSAIKAAFDQLKEQVGKHKDHLRSEHKWPRWRRVDRERGERQVPFEQTVAAVQAPTISNDDISTWVNANLARLYRFVERELRYRENLGLLPAEQLSPEEVVDEAIANALSEGLEKPERVSLEPWLYRLAMRALDELAARAREEVPSVPLEQNARRPDSRASYEPHLQFHQPDEAFATRDVVADARVATPEAFAAGDEMITFVEAVLGGARREEREAFLLHAIEGFTPEEIAVISDRSVEEVRSSITSAREHLRQRLPAAGDLKDRMLQQPRIA